MADGTQGLAGALEQLLAAFGRGVGEAQLELNRSSIGLQREIDADPELSQHGVTAAWYQIPSADMEFKVALTVVPGQSGAAPGTSRVPVLKAHPLNAAYQNQYRFEGTMASTMHVTVLPVPAQRTAAFDVPPRLDIEAATKAATPLLVKDKNGRVTANSKVVANFQVASRTWYVVQYAQVAGETTTLAVIEVDDQTGQARKR